MVELSSSQLDAIFHALADPTRRSMLRALAGGERSIGELAAPLQMSFAGASKHVKALEHAGPCNAPCKEETISAGSNPSLWRRPCTGCKPMNISGLNGWMRSNRRCCSPNSFLPRSEP